MSKARFSTIPAFLIMLQVIILDQLTKLWVRLSLELGESVPILEKVFGETFRLTHARNTGAAFSLSIGSDTFNRFFFVGTALIAVAFIIYLLRQNTNRLQVIAFGLVMGGALGNAVDRILLGGVTDFFDVNFPDFIMQRFPIFNIADSCIFIAMMLLIYEMFFIKDVVESKPSSAGFIEPAQIEVNNKEI